MTARSADAPAAEALVGTWALTRSVRDGDRSGTVAGAMVISPAPQGLRWREQGTLTMGALVVPVTRTSYLTEIAGEPWMTFEDGRPFHPWRPGEQVVHPCGEDVYVGRVAVADDEIATVWRVTGPGKDQLLTTRLRRVPEAST